MFDRHQKVDDVLFILTYLWINVGSKFRRIHRFVRHVLLNQNFWVVYFFQIFIWFDFFFLLKTETGSSWPHLFRSLTLVLRRMFKIHSDDTQMRIWAPELSQDTIWILFQRILMWLRAILNNMTNVRWRFKRRCTKHKGPELVGRLGFSWFLGNWSFPCFSKSSYFAAVVSYSCKQFANQMQCTVDMDYILDLLHFRLFVNMTNWIKERKKLSLILVIKWKTKWGKSSTWSQIFIFKFTTLKHQCLMNILFIYNVAWPHNSLQKKSQRQKCVIFQTLTWRYLVVPVRWPQIQGVQGGLIRPPPPDKKHVWCLSGLLHTGGEFLFPALCWISCPLKR